MTKSNLTPFDQIKAPLCLPSNKLIQNKFLDTPLSGINRTQQILPVIQGTFAAIELAENYLPLQPFFNNTHFGQTLINCIHNQHRCGIPDEYFVETCINTYTQNGFVTMKPNLIPFDKIKPPLCLPKQQIISEQVPRQPPPPPPPPPTSGINRTRRILPVIQGTFATIERAENYVPLQPFFNNILFGKNTHQLYPQSTQTWYT